MSDRALRARGSGLRAAARSWLGRLYDGLPEARFEAVLALLRSSLCGTGVLIMLLATDRSEGIVAASVVTAVVSVVSLLGAPLLLRAASAEQAREWGRWSTVADVLLYGGYTAAFHGTAGAGGLYGAFVLLMGPVRFGLRGALGTGVPVALIAIAWPQVDTAGATVGPGQTIALCVLFCLPAVVIRAVVTRGTSRLRLAELQFTTAFEHASIGMALTDLDLRVLQSNRSLGMLVGSPAHALTGHQLDDAIDGVDRGRFRSVLCALSPEAPSTRLEVQLRRPDGGLRWGHVSASLLSGAGAVSPRIVVQIENITERKRSEAMLSHAAAHDSLTDLPNRSMLLGRLGSALDRGDDVAVLFLDLDRFKVVNDGLGHVAGDLLLVQVAIRLRDIMRPDDLVARLGGDEFVVLCRNADEEVAVAVAERVIAALSEPVPTTSGGELVVGASIGVAMGRTGDSAEMVLRDADTAMYAAKAAGGGRVHLFSPDLRAAAVRTHELEVELRAAIRADQLEVAYQPVVHLMHGRVVGCEALARWNHPERGAVAVQEFVHLAEQTDLILELGDAILRLALRDVVAWPSPPNEPPPTVSVNVSLRQLLSSGYAARVAQVVQESGVMPSRLCLEVTETALVGDVDPVITVLEQLRAVGVRLAIDDFGTGHASLTYLARFPVDQVKIDQTFVAGLGSDAGSAAIVGGVLAMARTFDLRIVAEGVETEVQLNALRALGCDAVQGYLLAHPMSQADVVALMRRHLTAAIPLPREEPPLQISVADISLTERQRYRLLVEGAKDVTGRLGLDSVLEHTFNALGTAVSFTGGSILLVDDDQVRIAAAVPSPTEDALAARIPLGQGVSGTIALTGEPRYLPDITIASTVTAGRRSASSSTGVRSWYGVPLIAEGRPIGVLQVDSTEVDAFDEADRLAVLSFAPVVALAVMCARRSDALLRAMTQGQG